MVHYLIRRLILIPITLFFILLVNFVIINLAPGEPTTLTEIGETGEATRRGEMTDTTSAEERYLLFRERYGLTLPILFNNWPNITQTELQKEIEEIAAGKLSFKEEQSQKVLLGDKARFVLPKLVVIMQNSQYRWKIRKLAMRLIVRGGTKQATLGADVTLEQQKENEIINRDNQFLREQLPQKKDSDEVLATKINNLTLWVQKHPFNPTGWEKVKIFFTETRFVRYFSRVITLDFGTLRNDSNRTVIGEVAKRLKISLTLSLTPMFITFFISIFLGFVMALNQNRVWDYGLNLVCLILYAIPVFVVAPFLIEKVALNHNFPFTNTPIPISGFTSPDPIYNDLTSKGRLLDVIRHLVLPLTAILYGTMAAEARLARTSVLEVLRQDYVRTARAKGLSRFTIWTQYVGRNASITLITSLAGSLGVVLGGSLIVETLFEINGFGKFFYDAVVNRDYNVMLFSAIMGSFLALIGFLIADIAYTLLDPRVTLE